MNSGFQKLVLAWAVETFGPRAADPKERAARLVEEAIEAAQAVGVHMATVVKIADRVYSRPPGELGSEIGATMITLAAFAESVGHQVSVDAYDQWNHVLDIPAEHWAAKHRAKIEAGTAV